MADDASAPDSDTLGDQAEDPAGTDGGAVLGDAAREAFPSQVAAALAYAADNKYDYGPRFSKRNLAYEVAGAEPMGGGLTRVQLEYRPANSFRGASGTEYLDVDESGSVRARRQVRIPKESLPWVLMGIAAVSVILAAVVVPLILFTEETGDPLYVAGRTLFIRSEKPKTQEVLYYTGLDVNAELRNWQLLPAGTGTELALIEITVINQTSGSVSMVVDRGAAELRLEDGLLVRPIDIVSGVTPVETTDPRLNVPGFIPIWGSFELNKDQQITGWLVFEVPKGSSFKDMRWKASDSATVRYQ